MFARNNKNNKLEGGCYEQVNKVVLSIVLVTIFIMVGYCLFQINQTQRAVLLLCRAVHGRECQRHKRFFSGWL